MKTNNDINDKLKEAVLQENITEVKVLLSAGGNPNLEINKNKDTLLHYTSSVEICKELIMRFANVNARNSAEETPLLHAVHDGKEFELIFELLENGADVNEFCACGMSLHYAVAGQEIKVFRQLLERGACVNENNFNGDTPLNLVVQRDVIDPDIIKELIKYGAGIHSSNFDGQSPLRLAVFRSAMLTKLLIKSILLRDYQQDEDYENIIVINPYKDRSIYNLLIKFVKQCINEIEKMKSVKLSQKKLFSLYDFIKNKFVQPNQSCITTIPTNQCFILAQINYSVEYPIYNDIISDELKLFLERGNLLNIIKRIQIYTNLHLLDQDNEKKIFLDSISKHYVAEYLPNHCLLNLIRAFDDSNNIENNDCKINKGDLELVSKKRHLDISTKDSSKYPKKN